VSQFQFEEALGPRTRFDLNFHVGDIPVRVHPFFWLSVVLLGLPRPDEGGVAWSYLPIWIGLVFVSVLIHELGHVLVGRHFGRRGHILLTGFCGLAIGSSDLPERWQRNAVSLAGPAAGFLFAAVAAGLFWLKYPAVTLRLLGRMFGVDVQLEAGTEWPNDYVLFAMSNLLFINIFWGLVNLLPVWPLDGGQISREICQHYQGREGLRLSLMISFGTALGFSVLSLIGFIRKQPLIPYVPLESLFGVLFFGLLAFQSWQLLRFIRMAGLDWEQEEEPRQPWERDPDWWKQE
jgi:Zn-dependent protease